MKVSLPLRFASLIARFPHLFILVLKVRLNILKRVVRVAALERRDIALDNRQVEGVENLRLLPLGTLAELEHHSPLEDDVDS